MAAPDGPEPEFHAMTRKFAILLAPLLVLAACTDKEEPTAAAEGDPAMDASLGEQLMTDPDLVESNGANTAASVPSGDGKIPAEDMTAEAVAAARSQALKLVGGPGAMKKAPAAREANGTLPADSELTAAARAAAAPGTEKDCAAKARYTAAWAARLPATFPVYPRGAVQEAAGTDDGACALRVVNFLTPVPLLEVVDFYYTRASAAGFSAQHILDGEDNVLGGTKGRASYVVYARRLPGGATSVDLVTNGG
jgi:hypothetical protein